MKKKILTISAGLILWLFTLPAIAQEDVRPVPRWVSDRGYWVVEHSAKASIVYFYNNDNQLVSKRPMKGLLNTNRRKIKLWLTKQLEQAVTAREKGRTIGEDGQMVAGREGNK